MVEVLKNMGNKIPCPLVDEKITPGDCIENIDIVDGLIIESSLPDQYKQKENWKEICKNCKYHEY